MSVVQTIYLTQDKFPHQDVPVVYAVQGDTGREILMKRSDGTFGSGSTASLNFHRADDSYYNVSATHPTGSDDFTADITQALTRPGFCEAQLKVTSSSKVVSTFSFRIFVQPNINGLPVSQLGYDIYDLIDAANHITIDTTLSHAGQVADAKATGDAIALKADQDVIADAFSASATYAAGDYVMYGGDLYRFTQSHTSSAWSGTDVELVTVADALGDIEGLLADISVSYDSVEDEIVITY